METEKEPEEEGSFQQTKFVSQGIPEKDVQEKSEGAVV